MFELLVIWNSFSVCVFFLLLPSRSLTETVTSISPLSDFSVYVCTTEASIELPVIWTDLFV